MNLEELKFDELKDINGGGAFGKISGVATVIGGVATVASGGLAPIIAGGAAIIGGVVTYLDN